jgi:hypothetical protein
VWPIFCVGWGGLCRRTYVVGAWGVALMMLCLCGPFQAGRGATVLIHEATFETGKQQEALDKKHCTVPEAIDVASRMGAACVILTHFSQRYPHFPVIPKSGDLRVCVAFDLMRVNRVARQRPEGANACPVDACLCAPSAGEVFGPAMGGLLVTPAAIDLP